MIHLKKFNENKDNNELTIYNIMLYMINIVDEYNVEFYNVNSYVTYAKDVKEDTKFKFSENIYTKKKSNFSIKINGDMDYETYLSLGDEMLQIIKLLKENDWLLTDLSSNKRAGYPNELVFSSLNFKFSKPDETIIPQNH